MKSETKSTILAVIALLSRNFLVTLLRFFEWILKQEKSKVEGTLLCMFTL